VFPYILPESNTFLSVLLLLRKLSKEQEHIEKEYPLQWLKGIGPRRAEALANAGIETVEDLVTFYPRKYIDARKVIKLSQAKDSLWHSVTVRGKVIAVNHHQFPKPGRTSIKIADDSGGHLYLIYFAFAEWISKQYKTDDEIVAIGYMNIFRNDPQIVHPEFVEKVSDSKQLLEGRMLPVYRFSQAFKEARLSQMQLRAMLEQVVTTDEFKEATREVLPPEVLTSHNFPTRFEAISTAHNPESPESLHDAKERLKYEELFFLQLRFAVERMKMHALSRSGIRFDVSSLLAGMGDGEWGIEKKTPVSLIQQVLTNLPFNLTNAQKRVIGEIAHDMSKGEQTKAIPMNRLVQGDVGSGKTIVALLAMLTAVENGYQAVLMAPTEVLAKQHHLSISKMLEGLPIEVSLLVGKQPKKQREEILHELREGMTHIVIGTHALLEESVEFDKLGIVVADEQHKFGVEQRKTLVAKNPTAPPDVLIMTATPIPRTLAMTLYQDLDVSTIDELPAGRKEIVTRIVFPKEQRELFRHMKEAVVNRKEQVYIVYPQLEKSESKDVKTAISAYEVFKEKIFPDLRVGLVHGKLKSDEKQAVMAAFREHQLDILVATSVIEVGIDVANATLMVIGNAERFGLAQLHQLRGRVGRGGKQSECILVPSDKLSPDAQLALTSEEIEKRTEALERLRVLESTTNGFEIAKADLAMRGPGDFLGTQQSGVLKLKLADLIFDEDLLNEATVNVQDLLERDPQLRAKEHMGTRQELLRLYQEKESFLDVG
jgi:ATP-dependent DNA helicase RecG